MPSQRTRTPPAHPPGPAPARADAPPDPHSRTLRRLFFITLALIAVVLYTARILHPGPDSGEFWCDSNVINACRGYDQVGFRTTWGIPRLELGAPVTDLTSYYYTYPPGPYWFSYAGWRGARIVGMDPVLGARLFAQTCGLASAVLAFLLFSRLTHSRGLGALAALFYVISPPFLSLSAALHHMAYSPMLLFGAMLAWLMFESAAGPRRAAWLTLTALLFAADCWMNFEHMVFFALFVGVRTSLHFRLPVILGAALVGPIPIPIMALRVLHNAQLLGGWDQALRMFVTRARDRSGGGQLALNLRELTHLWLGRLGWPWIEIGRPARVLWNSFFTYPALSPCVLACVLASLVVIRLTRTPKERQESAQPRSPEPPSAPGLIPPAPARFLIWPLPAAIAPQTPTSLGLANALLLLAGGLTWFVVMPQHTMPHRFIILLLMPGLALLLGALAWTVLARTASAAHALPAWPARCTRLTGTALVCALLLLFAWEARRTDVLNHFFPFDAQVHRLVASKARGNANVAAAGRALARHGVTTVHIYDGVNAVPWRGVSIGLPFQFHYGQGVPTSLDPGHALYMEVYIPPELQACFASIERFGLPDAVAGTEARTYVFRAPDSRRRPDWRLDLPLTTGVTLRSMRSGRSLAGDHVVLLLWFTGELTPPPPPPATAGDPAAPPDVRDHALDRFTFTFRVRGAEGRELARVTKRIRWTQDRDQAHALVVMALPADRVPAGGTLELSSWDRLERGPVRLAGERNLPPGLATDPEGRVLRWPVSPGNRREP